jgi:hypothetical protein
MSLSGSTHSEKENVLESVRVRFLTAVTAKNAVFWDETPCGSCKSRRFVSIIRVAKIGELGTLAVTSN